MAQFARPNEDELNWGGGDAFAASSGSDLYAMIDETSASDSDYISSSDSGSDATYKVHLSSVTDPVSSSGHILRYRLKWEDAMEMGVDQPDVTVKLLIDNPDGSAPGECNYSLLSKTHSSSSNTLDTSFSTEAITLSTSQANSVSYSSLCFQIKRETAFGAGETVYLSWVELEVPDAPAAGGALPMAMNTYKQMRNN